MRGVNKTISDQNSDNEQISISAVHIVSDGEILFDMNEANIDNKYLTKGHNEPVEQNCYLISRKRIMINSFLHFIKTGQLCAILQIVTYSTPKFDFGFIIPLSEQMLPKNKVTQGHVITDIVELHKTVRAHGIPNFMGAHIPLHTQLNIQKWEEVLSEYWDQQLVQCLKYGFPMGFNQDCDLRHVIENHKSASDYPLQVQAYIKKELHFGALKGPFDTNPILEVIILHSCLGQSQGPTRVVS